MKKVAVSARRMSPHRGVLFVLLVLHERNLVLEARAQSGTHDKSSAAAIWKEKRAFMDAAETSLFRPM